MAPPSPLLSITAMVDDLERVEDRLLGSVQTSDPFLTELASHLIKAGASASGPPSRSRRPRPR